MGWVSPTGNYDPNSKWNCETNAYDESLSTWAEADPVPIGQWSPFIELTHASMWCDKVRLYALCETDTCSAWDIDAYYDGIWNHVYSGAITDRTWVEKSLASSKYITKFRFRGYNNNSSSSIYLRLYEVDFNLADWILPTVTTQSVIDILSTTATGRGNITVLGSGYITKRGICWNTTGSPTVTDSKAEETGSFGIGAFTRPITGLSPGVQYFVKAYAYNEAGYAYGSEVNFTTDKVAPTVTTQDPTDVLTTSVRGNGTITATGGEDCAERGFQYGLTQYPTWTKKVDVGGYVAGAFYLTINGLQPNTEYWYRAFAKNTVDPYYGYGAWVKFQTAAAGTTPTGTKISICSDYSGYTYILNESLTDDGNTYKSHFTISTDLADKQGLHSKKRLEDLYSYFEKKDGTCKIYIKRDSETTWQYCGEISMTGEDDIVVPHLPSENQDSSGDVDWLAKHFLIRFEFENDFSFIGLITEAVPIGVR